MQTRSTAFLLAVALSGACAHDRSPVLIGISGPFAQGRGASMRNGADLAVAEVNRAGGLRGRRLELVFADDSADATVAARIAYRFRDDAQIVAVVGHLTSGASIAAAPIYNGSDHPVVDISPSASSPELAGAGPYTFRICPTDRAHGARLAEFALTSLSTRRAAIIYENDDYGRGVRNAFRAAFSEQGGEIVTEYPYLPSLPTLEPYLLRSQRAGASVVVVAGTSDEAMRVISTADSLGIAVPLMGADEMVGVSPPPGWQGRLFVSTGYLPDQPGSVNQAFVQAYRTAYGGASPDHRAAGAYDAVRLLAAAIVASGVDRDEIRRYLTSLGRDRPAFSGVTGAIAFNGDGDRTHGTVFVATVENGLLRAASQP